jgi:hypothetical protein
MACVGEYRKRRWRHDTHRLDVRPCVGVYGHMDHPWGALCALGLTSNLVSLCAQAVLCDKFCEQRVSFVCCSHLLQSPAWASSCTCGSQCRAWTQHHHDVSTLA